MNDTQILELLKSNNYKKAGEKLYGYFPVVKKLIVKNRGSREDAEDIYQEALILLVRKVQAPDFILSSSLNTYLYSICRFLWWDRLKKLNRTIDVEIQKEQVTFAPQDEELFLRESGYTLAEKAFLQLGEKCRELLLLFYFKKQAMKEIAAKLKFSSEKVAKNQKYRCLEKAKAHLATLKTSGHE